MKKLFFTFAFSFLGCMVFAQTGALTVTNNNANCGVWVKMSAVDAGYLNGSACDITGITFFLAPGGSSLLCTNPGDFDVVGGGPGFAYFTSPMSHTDLITTTTFQWTDVTFQWQCPIPPCQSNNGGIMTDPLALLTSPITACLTGGTSWSGSSCLSGTSTWTNMALAGIMDNIVIDFN